MSAPAPRSKRLRLLLLIWWSHLWRSLIIFALINICLISLLALGSSIASGVITPELFLEFDEPVRVLYIVLVATGLLELTLLHLSSKLAWRTLSGSPAARAFSVKFKAQRLNRTNRQEVLQDGDTEPSAGNDGSRAHGSGQLEESDALATIIEDIAALEGPEARLNATTPTTNSRETAVPLNPRYRRIDHVAALHMDAVITYATFALIIFTALVYFRQRELAELLLIFGWPVSSLLGLLAVARKT